MSEAERITNWPILEAFFSSLLVEEWARLQRHGDGDDLERWHISAQLIR